MNVNIKDSEALHQHILNLVRNLMALKNRQIWVHFQNNIQIDITAIGPATLRLDLSDFRNFQYSLLIVLQQAFIKSVGQAEGRFHKDIVGRLENEEGNDNGC